MRAMNPASEKIKALMEEGGMRPSDVALANGMEVGTLYNVMSGAPSRQARQKLTDFFQTQIWTGILPSPRIQFEAGTTFAFPTAEGAKKFANEIGEACERHDRYVRLSTDLQWTLSELAAANEDPRGKAGPTIDIWCGEVPPDSPFSPDEKSPARQRRRQGHTAKEKKASKLAAATGRPSPSTRSRE